ncbi:zinc finger protein 11-like isoform X2 [Syngnathoides biaculeatus]|uniref:zinc finger protein 11-like isoform X2 n=1 Tax=Syngnathoides biaculeatus TaxID=300417 RepID=UPI002ADD6C4B|nr:zinc finger protein 11-like isoform X2 [Syngnathoides biaculeatus]
MDTCLFATAHQGRPLPASSLRLLVPPVQLLSASMWQRIKERDVTDYWEVADFVGLVLGMVPELLTCKHRLQLDLGLRARYILELCRREHLFESGLILSHMDKIKHKAFAVDVNGEQEAIVHFLELIQVLLKDPKEREHFFADVFPTLYGLEYDMDLQSLFWKFLCRLGKLLPVPDLKQTVYWLGASVSGACVDLRAETEDLKVLLQHHKHLRPLEQHDPTAGVGDIVLASLSAFPSREMAKAEEQSNHSGPDDGSHVGGTAEDEVAVEVIAEVEDEELHLMAENVIFILEDNGWVERAEGTTTDADAGKAEKGMDEKGRGLTSMHQADVHQDDDSSMKAGPSSKPHECADCGKKFKYASILTAHRVIHTGERPHGCPDCGRRFSFRQALERHRKIHQMERGYDCIICGEIFTSPSACTEHRQTHAEDDSYECPHCEKKFAWLTALLRHLKSQHAKSAGVGSDADDAAGEAPPENVKEVVALAAVRTGRRQRKPTMKMEAMDLQKRTKSKRKQEDIAERPPALEQAAFSCSEHSYGSPLVVLKDPDENCAADGASSRPERPVQHVKRLCWQDDETALAAGDCKFGFNCPDCDQSFNLMSALESHECVHAGEQPFLCSDSGRRFSFEQSLEMHKQTHAYEPALHGEFTESAAHNTLPERRTETPGEKADEVASPIKCPQCGRSFSCARYLTRHLCTRRVERAHACSCGKSFAQRGALTAHRRTHQKDRPHVCERCGKGFLYKGGLANHMKIHSSEMPFLCAFCGKCFKRERNLKKHERCHTRENVYSCSQCDKSFVYKATLVRHELTHSGERPYLCSDCGKRFFSHAELLKHERFHTGHKPFKCPHCAKTFTQSCYLTVHLRYHTGARPYSCAECNKGFLSANRLKRHTLTHTGEKPFPCEACGKLFRQSYHLKVHQRTHDKIM